MYLFLSATETKDKCPEKKTISQKHTLLTMTKLRHGSHGRDTWKSKASQFPTWKPWIKRGTQNEKLMIGVKKSTFFSPPNTWIINKNFFPEKQAHEGIIGDFDARGCGFELKHKNRLAG